MISISHLLVIPVSTKIKVELNFSLKAFYQEGQDRISDSFFRISTSKINKNK